MFYVGLNPIRGLSGFPMVTALWQQKLEVTLRPTLIGRSIPLNTFFKSFSFLDSPGSRVLAIDRHFPPEILGF